VIHILNITTFDSMKKGEKLSEIVYFLEIKDLYNKPVTLATCRSLRDAVGYASEFVRDMDNYQKVNRDFRSVDGAFVGVYFARKPNDYARFTTHLIVLIHSSKVELAENQTINDKLANINVTLGERMKEAYQDDKSGGSLENFKRFS
jgi:hypothetical protein